MTKLEYLQSLGEKYSEAEQVLITFTVYYHEDHTDYFMMYKLGDYAECAKYLENLPQGYLSLDNVMPNHKDVATQQVELAKTLDAVKS